MKYGLFGNFVANDGKRDELLTILVEASELLKLNQDCILYVVSITDDANAVWVYETWTDKEAHDKSLEPDNIRKLIQKAMPLIKAMNNQAALSVYGGKGV